MAETGGQGMVACRVRQAARVGVALSLSLMTAVAVGAGPAAAARGSVDSIASAFEQLETARQRVDELHARAAQLEVMAADERAAADARVDEREAERRRRVGRAVAQYRGQGQVNPLVHPQRQALRIEHTQRLFRAADDRSRSEMARLAREAAYLRALAAGHESQMVAARSAAEAEQQHVDTLTAKLANFNGTLTRVRPPAAIGAAGTPVARAADRAARALRGAPEAGWEADPAWLEARHELTKVLGRGERGAHELELEWDETPREALTAVLAALRQVGKSYVYATAGPSTFDCSGLTKRAYAEAGLGLPHFSAAQLHLGAPVPVPELRAGDLLAYGPDGADHVALYVGHGIAVEARSSRSGVVVDPARTGGSFAGAIRLVP